MMTQAGQAPKTRLGMTDTWFSPIGLGTWQFSQGRGLVGRFWPNLPSALILSIVEEALNHGIDWFDTASIYGGGQSEEMLAEALDVLAIPPDGAAIATKWWPMLRSAKHMETSIAERQRRLHHRPIALYQIHQPYSWSSISQQMEAMARLLDSGRIANAGVSNFSAAQMVQAYRALKSHGHRLASNQVRYHLLDRRIETNGVMSAAEDLGVSIIAYSPLGQGLLSGRFHGAAAIRPSGMRRYDSRFRPTSMHRVEPLIAALREIGERYQVTPAQVALNWIVSRSGIGVFAIPGATRVSQAAQSAGAMSFTLSASDRQALDHVSSRVAVTV